MNMTSSDFMNALNAKGIETTLDSDGVVVMLLSESEFKKDKKYARIVKETGWNASWGRKVKCETHNETP